MKRLVRGSRKKSVEDKEEDKEEEEENEEEEEEEPHEEEKADDYDDDEEMQLATASITTAGGTVTLGGRDVYTEMMPDKTSSEKAVKSYVRDYLFKYVSERILKCKNLLYKLTN